MSTLAERLISRRSELQLTQESLAKKAGVTRVAISKAELGMTKNFNSNTLFKIAQALVCDPQWLQTGLGSPDVSKPSPKVWDENVANSTQPNYRYSYPKLNWVQAGRFAQFGDNYDMYDIENWHDSVKYAGERGFWLEIKGDSMTSPQGVTFPEGMSILINPEKDPHPNCYVIAQLKSSGEITFKKYVTDMGREFLKPLNPQYPMIELNYDCEIIGVVVDARWDIF
ncbi:prophage repressor protein [Yersinia pekkanenii]|uniref:Prophage repressor protein n=1 Tax=Yersinia pekkanenii TaxID=1288385 RepID=A0A0T9RQC4_9GAMM|nr:S24 family peptidase [Yersinia pekkanenii]CNI74738.1 prophage repressor protein [Yersinia pekkanenii]